MSDFKAKMHQIRFWLAIRPRPRWGSSQHSPYTLAYFYREERGREWGGEGNGRGQERKRRGREWGWRGRERKEMGWGMKGGNFNWCLFNITIRF